MINQNCYVVDFSKIENYLEMHQAIQVGLSFPAHYGYTWDAFWDSLRDMIGQSVYIRIVGFDVLQKKLPKDADSIWSILKEFKHYRNDAYCDAITIEIVRQGNSIILS